MSIDILREAEADLAELARLPAEIRTKIKAGLADLRRLRDAIDTTIASLAGGAQATLASLQALAPIESGDRTPAAGDPAPAPVEGNGPALPV